MKLPRAKVAEILTAGGEFDPKAVAQAYSIDLRNIHPPFERMEPTDEEGATALGEPHGDNGDHRDHSALC